jgi:hypothetical protein
MLAGKDWKDFQSCFFNLLKMSYKKYQKITPKRGLLGQKLIYDLDLDLRSFFKNVILILDQFSDDDLDLRSIF